MMSSLVRSVDAAVDRERWYRAAAADGGVLDDGQHG
jgi:hypothetical protein